MGDNPADSVTDANCQLRGATNVYVAGPALFPTIGSPNPMLSGIALARRLGDRLLPPPRILNLAAEPGFRYLFQGTETATAFQNAWIRVGGGAFARVGRTLIASPGMTG